jgi:iron complex transport system permease protein
VERLPGSSRDRAPSRYLLGAVPLGALVGGVLAVAIVYRIAQTRWAQLDNYALILSGVALAALFSAITSFLLFYSGASHDARRLIFWILGGLGGAQWVYVFGLLSVLIIAGAGAHTLRARSQRARAG